MTVLSPSLLTSAGSARVSLGATLPMAKSARRKENTKFLTSMKLGPEVVNHSSKACTFTHGLDLRQIEPSYNVCLRWVYIKRFLKGTVMVGRLESKKVPGLYTKAVARRVAGELCARF
jgi:hypothetical protein